MVHVNCILIRALIKDKGQELQIVILCTMMFRLPTLKYKEPVK
jgi:hypothetical protein